jgi:dUTPase
MKVFSENEEERLFTELKVHYRDDNIKLLYQKAGFQTSGSVGLDLVNVEDITGDPDTPLIMADLGLVVKVPVGFHTIIMPRSSTFKKFGIQQGNSIGLIDNDYCGAKDFLGFCIYDTLRKERDLFIPKGTRLCQLVVMPTVMVSQILEFNPEEESRGGWGSTDETIEV